MEKIWKIKQHDVVRYDIDYMNPIQDQFLTNVSYEELSRLFSREVAWGVTRFYANPSNKGKSYNLVLATDDELNELEKKSIQ